MVRRFSQRRSAGSEEGSVGGREEPELGRYERMVRSWVKQSTSVAARLSIVPFVQCMLGPPRSVKERPSSNVAPDGC